MTSTRRDTDYEKAQFNVAVGRAVRTMRIGADMSIAKLSDEAGISASMLTNIEHGSTALPLYAARNIAECIDCTIDDLVPVTIDAEED